MDTWGLTPMEDTSERGQGQSPDLGEGPPQRWGGAGQRERGSQGLSGEPGGERAMMGSTPEHRDSASPLWGCREGGCAGSGPRSWTWGLRVSLLLLKNKAAVWNSAQKQTRPVREARKHGRGREHVGICFVFGSKTYVKMQRP